MEVPFLLLELTVAMAIFAELATVPNLVTVVGAYLVVHVVLKLWSLMVLVAPARALLIAGGGGNIPSGCTSSGAVSATATLGFVGSLGAGGRLSWRGRGCLDTSRRFGVHVGGARSSHSGRGGRGVGG